jgi:hypothetical protein
MLRDLLFKNLGWKLLSLALAAAIWLTVKTVSNETAALKETRFDRLPVRIVSGSTDVRAFKVEPEFVAVIIRGRPETIERMTDAELRPFVDLTGADLDRDFRRRVDVTVPRGVTVVTVEPADAVVLVPSRNLLKFPSNP